MQCYDRLNSLEPWLPTNFAADFRQDSRPNSFFNCKLAPRSCSLFASPGVYRPRSDSLLYFGIRYQIRTENKMPSFGVCFPPLSHARAPAVRFPHTDHVWQFLHIRHAGAASPSADTAALPPGFRVANFLTGNTFVSAEAAATQSVAGTVHLLIDAALAGHEPFLQVSTLQPCQRMLP